MRGLVFDVQIAFAGHQRVEGTENARRGSFSEDGEGDFPGLHNRGHLQFRRLRGGFFGPEFGEQLLAGLFHEGVAGFGEARGAGLGLRFGLVEEQLEDAAAEVGGFASEEGFEGAGFFGGGDGLLQEGEGFAAHRGAGVGEKAEGELAHLGRGGSRFLLLGNHGAGKAVAAVGAHDRQVLGQAGPGLRGAQCDQTGGDLGLVGFELVPLPEDGAEVFLLRGAGHQGRDGVEELAFGVGVGFGEGPAGDSGDGFDGHAQIGIGEGFGEGGPRRG